jgi:polyisoprenyl-teichoic acid--peptidoglycan teichoic acid transferase
LEKILVIIKYGSYDMDKKDSEYSNTEGNPSTKQAKNKYTNSNYKMNKGFETETDVTKWIEEILKDEFYDDEVCITEEDDFLENINSSLAGQVRNELNKKDKIPISNKKKRFFHFLKVIGITFGIIISILAILVLTPTGRNFLWQSATNYAYGKMNYDDGLAVTPQIVEDDVDENVIDPVTIMPTNELEEPKVLSTENSQNGPRQEDGVINILLLGEEAIDAGGGRGRTDIMIIATMNTNTKTFKLTSLMRDMLVQIPGYKDNKLNSAYEAGGIPLLYQTIELNFDIKLDGYVLVGFDDFENIINKLGGVNLTLTASEAHYLNTTNYISKPEYRTVVAGKQHMNGNQALGYCRIRYVATGDNEMNDFGRTSRQRIVLNAIFDQYKQKSLPELVFLLNDILPKITTDVLIEDFENYLKDAVTMGLSDIDNLRIPADHTYDEGYVRQMSVLIPDLPENIKIIHNFIFGSTN